MTKEPQILMWWLSFGNESGVLGAAIIEAETPYDACLKAQHLRLVSVSHQCAVMAILPQYYDQARPYRNRLMQLDEIERVFGCATATLGELFAAGASITVRNLETAH